ncbi:hypothetical protein PMG11_00780 [Penicillium brasilianum]|uniref:Uncharacterized protein n=1 Tax=Penicillium brasilianum TaxID=104259 RepID=A0A0F7TF15_PENBI|nr:hypothetical protein PMG11_00780 [Penicillium brasilianum]
MARTDHGRQTCPHWQRSAMLMQAARELQAALSAASSAAPGPSKGKPKRGGGGERPREGNETPPPKKNQPPNKKWPTPTKELYKRVSNEEIDKELKKLADLCGATREKLSRLERRVRLLVEIRADPARQALPEGDKEEMCKGSWIYFAADPR